MTPSALHLACERVTARYGARLVLHDISFSLHQHETLVVSGANGSGKSTLLRLLCGLQQPDGGTIRYTCDTDPALDPRQAMHLVGWVSPDLALYRELTARENLHFFAALRNMPYTDTQVDELLERVGLGGRGDDRVSSYSSGMTHRLRYAYALLHAPPVLLLDEPTVTLDEKGAAVVDAVIAAQQQHGITVIATNDPRELRYGDYVLTLGPQTT